MTILSLSCSDASKEYEFMAGISLTSAINGNFLRRLSAASNSDTPALAFNSGAITTGEKVDITSTLRFGAKTYTRAMQNLNSGISLLNNSYASLEKLIDITEKVVDVAKRAVEPGVGEQSRRRLTYEFRELANEFRDVVDKATLGDYEYLDTESLSSFFQVIGLDPAESNSIAKVFKKFILRPEDSLLSSELVDNQKRVSVPASAYEISGTPPYGISKNTNSALTPTLGSDYPAGISTGYNVFASLNDSLVPPTQTISIQSSTGTSQLAVSAGSDVSLLEVNESSGYSVITSSENFLGFNPDGVEQAYLVDTSGSVVQQLTNFSSLFVGNVGDVALSADSKTVLYSWEDETAGDFKITQVVIGAFGENPSASIRTDLGSAGSLFSSLSVSNDGLYGAFIDNDTNSAIFLETGTGDTDIFLSGLTDARGIGFLDNNQVAVLRSASDNSSTSDWSVSSFTYGSGTLNVLQSGLAVSEFSTLQSSSSGSTGYFSIKEESQNQIRMYDESSLITSYSLQGADSVNNLTMAFDSSGRAKIGIGGVVRSLTGDTDIELYTLSSSSSLNRSTTKWEEIFDDERNLIRKADAYQLKADAEDLLRVLTNNRDSILELRETVVKNAQLLRTAGLAFLSVASDVDPNETPEQIAQKLVSLINQNLRGAFAQAENLNPLTVAALTRDS